MRRAVKAWVLHDADSSEPVCQLLKNPFTPVVVNTFVAITKREAARAYVTWAGERVVRATITYDDGRPAPKRRKKGGRRG